MRIIWSPISLFRIEEIVDHISEDSSAAAQKISNELSDTRKNEEIGDAWAKLEHSMLSKELEEE